MLRRTLGLMLVCLCSLAATSAETPYMSAGTWVYVDCSATGWWAVDVSAHTTAVNAGIVYWSSVSTDYGFGCGEFGCLDDGNIADEDPSSNVSVVHTENGWYQSGEWSFGGGAASTHSVDGESFSDYAETDDSDEQECTNSKV